MSRASPWSDGNHHIPLLVERQGRESRSTGSSAVSTATSISAASSRAQSDSTSPRTRSAPAPDAPPPAPQGTAPAADGPPLDITPTAPAHRSSKPETLRQLPRGVPHRRGYFALEMGKHALAKTAEQHPRPPLAVKERRPRSYSSARRPFVSAACDTPQSAAARGLKYQMAGAARQRVSESAPSPCRLPLRLPPPSDPATSCPNRGFIGP